MVFTLQRYIFRELFRVFALATIGLTLILSLGGILQPVQEYGVGPRQVVHILVYFMPITLTFVLPMAALFASALTYGRFASDNELDACRASGISLMTMVYPGLVLAILVAIANLLLSFHVMPYFVHLAERSLKADAKQILFRNIQRRGFYSLPPDKRFMIYADYVDPPKDTLAGIVIVQRKDDGTVKTIHAAESARAHFDPHDESNEVRLDAYGVRRIGEAKGNWFTIGILQASYPFGSLLGDDIKFKRVGEMKEIRADLMKFDPIRQIARAAFSQLATELLAHDISGKITTPQHDPYELRGTDRVIRFSATSCALEEESKINLLGPMRVQEFDAVSGEHLRTFRCDTATIHVDDNEKGPGLGLSLDTPRVEATQQRMTNYSIANLDLPKPLHQRLHVDTLLATLSPAGINKILPGSPSSFLAKNLAVLNRKITRTRVDIKAEMNSRLVFGIGCLPMIMIGIGLGIVKRGGHLLSAFGASCIPAAVLIVAIISGKHVTENMTAQGVSGILVMWAGLACLTILAAVIYARLAKN